MSVTYLKSLAELALLTFAVTFLGLLSATGFDLLDVSAVKAAGVASMPAVLSVVYGAVARLLGNFNSALAVDTRERQH
mgnify:CR=1 FL=1